MGEVFVLEDLLNTLIELENRGFSFYQKHKNITDDSELQSLFEELALAEKNHEKYYKSVKEDILNKQGIVLEEDYHLYVTALINNNFFVRNSDIEVKTMEDALEMAERLEKDTIIFLNELQGIVNQEKGFTVILEEEKRHLLRIIQYKESLGIR